MRERAGCEDAVRDVDVKGAARELVEDRQMPGPRAGLEAPAYRAPAPNKTRRRGGAGTRARHEDVKCDEPPEGGSSDIKPAASYSPGPLRAKYHRR